MAIIYFLHENPDATSRMLALLNLDMVGDHQVLSESIRRLYRTPHSLPSFVNDVVQEMFEVVGAGNSISLGGRRLLDFGSSFRLPIVESSGSRDPFYYYIEDFWGRAVTKTSPKPVSAFTPCCSTRGPTLISGRSRTRSSEPTRPR